MAIITYHATVSGRVQGVFFRDCTRKKAWELELTGWVKNLPNGNVETVFSGPADSVEKMKEWLHEGSPHARVDEVTFDKVNEPTPFSYFEIVY
ncbi:MAG: acylphosphatase [Desulfobulbaceae bacterium]|nr:MAG: acylphosphatase [Desulfobulbaceae bacterium]